MYDTRLLPSGIRLLSERIDTAQTAAFGIWVANGSRYESAAENGISHFIEHMIFKGTSTRTARELAFALDELGGQGNAFTDRECTCYYIKVLGSRLREGVCVLADMLLDSKFANEDIALERSVVGEEIDMYEDTPDDVAIDGLFSRCFAESSLGRPILGTRKTLATFDCDRLHDYVRRHYRPQDIVLSVAGSFTDEDLDFIAERFGELCGEGKNSYAPAVYRPALMLREKQIEQNHLCLNFEGVSLHDENRYGVQLLSAVLGGGMSSRLFQAVREQNGLCYSIYSYPTGYHDTGLFSIYVGLSAETEAQALNLIRDEIASLCQDGVSEDELRRAREQLKTSLLMGLESTNAHMMHLGRSTLLRGTMQTPEQMVAAYERVTTEDLLGLARTIFVPQKCAFAAVGRPQSEDFYRALLPS